MWRVDMGPPSDSYSQTMPNIQLSCSFKQNEYLKSVINFSDPHLICMCSPWFEQIILKHKQTEIYRANAKTHFYPSANAIACDD